MRRQRTRQTTTSTATATATLTAQKDNNVRWLDSDMPGYVSAKRAPSRKANKKTTLETGGQVERAKYTRQVTRRICHKRTGDIRHCKCHRLHSHAHTHTHIHLQTHTHTLSQLSLKISFSFFLYWFFSFFFRVPSLCSPFATHTQKLLLRLLVHALHRLNQSKAN